jgi:hypothetical protein
MNNLNKITKILAATFVLATSTIAMADQVATGTATVEVLNTFAFSATSSLDFGVIRATADSTAAGDVATLLMSGDPAATATPGTTVNLAAITVLTEGSPAEFTVSGVANFANLTIVVPVTATVMTASGLPGTAANFSVNSFTAWITSGGNTGLYSGTNKLLADNGGAATFNVGATLTTDDAAAAITQGYEDGIAYSGTFDVTIEY